jgi:hypothetical protein
MKELFSNSKYAMQVGYIAIVIQTMFTLCITTYVLLQVNTPYPYFVPVLVKLLSLDVLFITVHISYRVLYKGPKVALDGLTKKVLALHVVTSIIALVGTYILCSLGMYGKYFWAYILVVLWLASLLSGLVFFGVKYLHR